MRKFSVVAAVAVLLMGTPAFAQMSNQPAEPGTLSMNDSGYHQTLMLVEGRITEFDLSRGTLTLEDGTQFTLAPSFEYTSFPMVGQEADVTYAEENGKKVVRMIDTGSARSSHDAGGSGSPGN
jgi:hypothetical protein